MNFNACVIWCIISFYCFVEAHLWGSISLPCESRRNERKRRNIGQKFIYGPWNIQIFFASFIQFFRLANWMAMNVGVLRWNGIIWVGFMRREPPLHVQVGSQPLQEHNVIALKSFSFFEIRFSNDLYFLSHSYSSIFKSVARGCSFIVNACTFCDDVKMHLDNESNSSLCAKSENLFSHSFCLFCYISYSS